MAIRILGPREVLAGRPSSIEECRAFVDRMARQAGSEVRLDRMPLHAFINYGRHVAICPNCGAGIAVHPEWSTFAACLGEWCYSVFSTVVFPGDLKDIEQVLLARPLKHRHWVIGEPIEALRAENAARGLPVDKAQERLTP